MRLILAEEDVEIVVQWLRDFEYLMVGSFWELIGYFFLDGDFIIGSDRVADYFILEHDNQDVLEEGNFFGLFIEVDFESFLGFAMDFLVIVMEDADFFGGLRAQNQ